jgi:hypothetical protein
MESEFLSVLLSWQFIAFSLSVVAIVFILKTIVDFLLINVILLRKDTKVWSELILPLLPSFIGIILAIIIKKNSFPYPKEITTFDARIIFGLVSGLLSGVIFRIVKAMLFQKAGITLPVDLQDPFADNIAQKINQLPVVVQSQPQVIVQAPPQVIVQQSEPVVIQEQLPSDNSQSAN